MRGTGQQEETHHNEWKELVMKVKDGGQEVWLNSKRGTWHHIKTKGTLRTRGKLRYTVDAYIFWKCFGLT